MKAAEKVHSAGSQSVTGHLVVCRPNNVPL